jgi:hypothetical protein
MGGNKKGFGGIQRKEVSRNKALFILYLTGGHVRKAGPFLILPFCT